MIMKYIVIILGGLIVVESGYLLSLHIELQQKENLVHHKVSYDSHP